MFYIGRVEQRMAQIVRSIMVAVIATVCVDFP